MANRLRAVLPAAWFADDSPVLAALLGGLASAWAWSHAQLAYVRAQTRIATASDIWLDVIAQDFFGRRVRRVLGQSDDALRTRISRELLRDHGTRPALNAALQDLTGRTPVIFEPARIADTGAYGSAAVFAYGAAGAWGSLSLPFQCFVTAARPIGTGIATVAGWSRHGSTFGGAGYGIGAIEFASLAMVQGQVTDTDIYAAVADVMPAATIGWVRISN